MSGKSRPLAIEPPWKGLELREAAQSPQHDECALNVDYRNGRKEAREGFVAVSAALPRGMVRLHVSETPSGDARWIVAAGPDGGDGYVKFAVLASDGRIPDWSPYSWDLTTLHGEPGDPTWECSFVDTSVIMSGYARFVTLLCTKASTYLFDPSNPTAGVVRLSTNRYDDATPGHAIKQYRATINYMKSPPRGSVACEHLGAVFRAGFRAGTEAELTNLLEASQDLVPESVVKQNQRNVLTLQPWLYSRSDPYDPAGVPASGLSLTEDREPITGLVSTGDALLVFTSKSLYVRTGGLDDYVQRRVAGGVGCVAPRSIVDVQGIVHYMSYDGVYAYGGLSAGPPVKVSGAIDPFFLSRRSQTTFVPAAFGTRLRTILGGWPPRVAHGELPWCEGMYVPSRRQIWWSLPIVGRMPWTFPATLVLDLPSQAWSIWGWTARGGAGGESLSCFVSGVTVRAGGDERIVVANAWTEALRMGGAEDVSTVVDVQRAGVPLLWQTPRIPGAGDVVSTWRAPTFKMLGLGKTPATGGPTAIMTGEGAFHDAGDALREETSAALDCHPRSDAGTSFWGTGVWGTMAWAPVDWFTSVAETYVKSESCRIGMLDDPGLTPTRQNLACVHSFTVQVDAERGP